MSAHTPGPWRWELNGKSRTMQLVGGVQRFDLTVLDFVRWGMDSAAARFRTGPESMNIMKRADDFAVVAPGREHHAEWFRLIDHPDAALIAAAPDLLAALERIITEATGHTLASLDQAKAAIAKARGGK